MPAAPFDLNNFIFTPDDDEVLVDDTLAIAAPGFFFGIVNEAPVDALAGDDRIEGLLDGTIDDFVGMVTARGMGLANDVETGEGSDELIGMADFTRAVGGGFGTFGITGPATVTTTISTGDNGDLIYGSASADGLRSASFGISGVNIDTGEGRDTVKGEASSTSAGQFNFSSAFGLVGGGAALEALPGAILVANNFDLTVSLTSGAEILTGPGNDTVEGIAAVNVGDTGSFNAGGIIGGEIDTGDGRDTVYGKVEVQAGDNVLTFFSTAISAGLIETGAGNDEVRGHVEATFGASASANFAAGINGDVKTGDGRDQVDGKIDLTVGMNAEVGFQRGIGEFGAINTGAGNDDVTGSVEVEAGDSSFLGSLFGANFSILETGDGQDAVTGSAKVDAGADTDVRNAVGIFDGLIITEAGNDVVEGQSDVSAGAGSDVFDADGIRDAEIITGDGRDRVEATSTIQGAGLTTAFGSGISRSIVNTGASDDTIIAHGADIAVGGDSFGIDGNASIFLGTGDDEVTARGATAGVGEAFIFGQEGDDIFDLHSGMGTIIGGDDDDLLILAGESTDFGFAAGIGSAGTITDLATGGSVTDMDVAEIERFQFDDGTFDFGDLF